jgi:hypothetical protein
MQVLLLFCWSGLRPLGPPRATLSSHWALLRVSMCRTAIALCLPWACGYCVSYLDARLQLRGALGASLLCPHVSGPKIHAIQHYGRLGANRLADLRRHAWKLMPNTAGTSFLWPLLAPHPHIMAIGHCWQSQPQMLLAACESMTFSMVLTSQWPNYSPAAAILPTLQAVACHNKKSRACLPRHAERHANHVAC